MIRPLCAMGLGLLVLSACAELNIPKPDWFGTDNKAEKEVAAAPKPKPAPLDPMVGYQGPQTGIKEAPPMPRRKPEQVAAVPENEADPGSLLGLDFDKTKAMLGIPALQTEQPPAKVWAYNGGNCVLNVFFYPTVGGSNFRVLTYEVKGGEETDKLARRCFTDLLNEKSPPPAEQ